MGGAADKTPPALVVSEPENESVEVRPEFIRLTFSDYLDEPSFTQAFSITPSPGGAPQFRWRGRSVTIRFEDQWRDSTTYVITLDTRLRSWRGVGLLQPIVIAFATGSVIDQGRLRGRAVDALRGSPAEGLRVFAFPAQGAESEEPAYMTSTGENGQFDLSYVREADYYVIVLQDANRNNRPDPTERFAVPPRSAMRATPDTTRPRGLWVVGTLDTLAPTMDRVRALSATRLSARFSEAILMPRRAADQWTISDSASGLARAVRQVYRRMNDPTLLYLRTEALDDRTWSLRPDSSLADSSGNVVATDQVFFSGRTQEDTTQLRFIGFVPRHSDAEVDLSPRDPIALEFNQPVADTLMQQVTQVTDSLGQPVPFSVRSESGSVYYLDVDSDVSAFVVARIELGNATYEQTFRRLSEHDLGSLSGAVLPGGPHVVVELYPETANKPYDSVHPDSAGAFGFVGLTEETYLIRAFLDHNGNGRWDAGTVWPYAPAEPISWLAEPLTVRPRWDTAAADTLRLRVLDSSPTQ